MIEIQEREHSEFSPSSLERKLSCQTSIVLEMICENKNTYAAAEGTAAHYVCDQIFACNIMSMVGETIKVGEFEVPVDDDMINCALEYAKYITKICLKKGSKPTVYNEQRLKLPGNDGRVFGYADTLLIFKDEIHVIDYKYGRVHVSPIGNKQLMTYVLGALEYCGAPPGCYRCHGHIFQPRAMLGTGFASSCEYSADKLQELQHQIDDLVARTDEFDSYLGSYFGSYSDTPLINMCQKGQYCDNCSAIHICPSIHDSILKAAIDINTPGDELNMGPQLFAFLNADRITKYLKKCKENLRYRALGGENLPGTKVVRGIKHRRWDKDSKKILKELTEVYGLSADDVSDVKIKSISDVKQLVGAKNFKEIEENLTTKPTGELTIAPLSDRRKAVEIELDDFKDE